MRSFSSPDMPPRNACAPTRANWMTAAPPPRMAKSPMLQCPANITLLENTTLLPTRQSWPTCELARKAQRSPTTVCMLPPAVPGFMVTPSRIRQSLPTVSEEGSPLYFRSCGIWPMEANGNSRVPAPMLVRPATTTWLISLTPRASLTSGPTVQKGPISTSSASSAPVSTIAVGCTLELGIIRIQNHGADLGLGDDLPVHFGFAIKPPGATAAANLAHMVVKMVPGQHGLAKLCPVYPHEINELRLVIGLEVRNAQGACGLGQPLDDQYAWHDREAGKVPLKEGFIDGDALDADAALIAVHFNEPVDQQKRIAMRQQFHDPRNVRAAQFLLGRLRFAHDPARTNARASTICLLLA